MIWPFLSSQVGNDVVIVDHSLMDAAGHHLNVAQALTRTIAEENCNSRILTLRSFQADDYPDLNAQPIFLNRTYEAVSSIFEHPSRYDAVTRKFGVELSHALHDAKENCVVLPTLTFAELPGLAEWILKHPSPEQLQVFFWIVFGPEFMTSKPTQIDMIKTWYKQGFEALEQAAVTGSRICPIVETAGLHEIWQPMTKLRISVIRLPSMVHHLAKQSAGDSGATVVIGYGGDVRDGKGFELLPDIIDGITELHPQAKFDVRVNVGPLDQHRFTIGTLTNDFGTNVSLRLGSMDPVRFQTFLAGCDVILLPYDPDVYSSRGSSICDEAEVLGRPQVVPHDVSFSQKVLSAGAANGFAKYSSEAVTAALDEMLTRLKEFETRALELRALATDQNREFLSLMKQNKKRV